MSHTSIIDTDLINRICFLSRDEFEEMYKTRPFIITNGAKDWPAIKSWNPNTIHNKLPKQKHEITVFTQDKIPKKSFIKLDAKEIFKRINTIDPLYKYYFAPEITQITFPDLFADIVYPSWISQQNVKEMNFWFSQQYNQTILHFDLLDNFLVQIYGKKKIRLFSPDDSSYLYPTITTAYDKPRLSKICNLDDVDFDKFPDFIHAHCYEGIIMPSDIIYIPAGWWHEVQSLDISLSVNFFWQND
jgi:hypothetical protein